MPRRPPPDNADLPTIRSALTAGCMVDAICPGCDHIGRLDLAALDAAGHGDRPLIRLPLVCSACGAGRCQVIVSGQAYRH